MVLQAFQHPPLSAWKDPGAELLALEIISVNGKLLREARKDVLNSVEENKSWS